MSSIPLLASTDLDGLLSELDASDSSLRAPYSKLAEDPNLATEYEA
jgi:hypothetical protein